MRTSDDIATGAALILGAMALLGVTDNFVRIIADDAGLWQFHLLRSAMALPMLGVFALVAGVALRPKRPGAVAVRSLIQTAAMLLYFGALPTMPVAQVAAALFSAPLWVLLFAAVLFGRRIDARTGFAAALGFVGVLVMLRPTPANLSPLTLMPLAAGALYGLSNLLTRETCAEESPATLVGRLLRRARPDVGRRGRGARGRGAARGMARRGAVPDRRLARRDAGARGVDLRSGRRFVARGRDDRAGLPVRADRLAGGVRVFLRPDDQLLGLGPVGGDARARRFPRHRDHLRVRRRGRRLARAAPARAP